MFNYSYAAWYVFSALGFNPVCPASNEFVLGSLLFERAIVHIENGKHIVIDARDNNTENISKMKLNGKEHTCNYLTHDVLTKGATIKLQMSNTPNRSRGTKADDAPYSFSKE